VVIHLTHAKYGVGEKMAADQHFRAMFATASLASPELDMAASLQPKGNPFHCGPNLLLSSGRMLRGHFGGLFGMGASFSALALDIVTGPGITSSTVK